jgi:3-hydroxyisobutyrate dehydrogenase-like beta-hydroxyacid dehydrogenase
MLLAALSCLACGVMGRSIAACFATRGYHVYAWNRGEKGRQQARELHLDNHLVVYDDIQDAMKQQDAAVVVMAVLGDPDLAAATQVIQSVPKALWKGKILVQYSSHEPLSIKDQEAFLQKEMYEVSLIGGAIITAPEMVCSDEAVYLLSSSDNKTIKKASPTLETLGTLVLFEGGDVGAAALADVCEIQSEFFGIAGVEMCHLLMELYGVNAEYKQRVTDFVTEHAPTNMAYFIPMIANAIRTNDFDAEAQSAPAKALLSVLEMHHRFMEKLGIVDDVFTKSYSKYLKQVPGDHGFSEVVKFYTTEITKDDEL